MGRALLGRNALAGLNARLGLTLLAAALFFFGAIGRANAHAIGLSTGEYRAAGDAVEVKLAFARGDVAALVPTLDANHDGALDDGEVQGARAAIERATLARVDVKKGAAACAPALTDASLTEQDGLIVRGTFSCATNTAAAVAVELSFLDDLSFGHRHMARVIGAETSDEVLYRSNRKFTFAAANANGHANADANANANADADGHANAHADGSATVSAAKAHSSGLSFFRMGIEHILTGYDHLVFLFGLVLIRGRVRSMLAVVTAFTVAHSITLAVAVTGLWAPSSNIVEPAIALSIAYVGIENFFVKSAEGRWRITFPFGLIHGFGFAGALRELDLPSAKVPVALVTFNLGVEAGQLATMAVLLPLVYLLREKTAFSMRGMKVLSTAVAVAGGVWFISRVMS